MVDIKYTFLLQQDFFHPLKKKSFDRQLYFLNKETKIGLKLKTKKNQKNDCMVL